MHSQGTYSAQLRINGRSKGPSIATTLDAADLLRRRPDIIAAERRVSANNARIRQALAEYYPKISLSELLGSQAIGPGHLFKGLAFSPLRSQACAGDSSVLGALTLN